MHFSMSEAVTVPNSMMMTSTVSEESLARDTHTHTHARTHACTHTHTCRLWTSTLQFAKSLQTINTILSIFRVKYCTGICMGQCYMLKVNYWQSELESDVSKSNERATAGESYTLTGVRTMHSPWHNDGHSTTTHDTFRNWWLLQVQWQQHSRETD